MHVGDNTTGSEMAFVSHRRPGCNVVTHAVTHIDVVTLKPPSDVLYQGSLM